MPYVVEVALEAANLADELNQMRTWLDHMKFQIAGFRQTRRADICRVDFESEEEARVFAEAFAGRVLTHAGVMHSSG